MNRLRTLAEIDAPCTFEFAGLEAGLNGFYHLRPDGSTQTINSALVSIPDFVRRANVRSGDRDYGRVEANI